MDVEQESFHKDSVSHSLDNRLYFYDIADFFVDCDLFPFLNHKDKYANSSVFPHLEITGKYALRNTQAKNGVAKN